MTTISRRKVALLLSSLILAAVPVQADPITLGRASQMLALQLQSDVRIGGVPREGTREDPSWRANPFRVLPETTMYGGEVSSRWLLSGLTIGSHMQLQGLGNVQGDVQGRVCDCGEILIAGGGFPKWPLFFLGAIPFFFIHGGEDIITTTTFVPPVPTSTLPPPSVIPQVPEYTSLLLFGTGLLVIGAFGRQTFRRKRVQ